MPISRTSQHPILRFLPSRFRRLIVWLAVAGASLLVVLVFWEWVIPWKIRVHIEEWWCRLHSVPNHSVTLSLACEMARDFNRLPRERWLDHLLSIPPPLRFFILRMMDPETSLTLLSMLEERACTRFPHQTATVHSLFAKTAELYRLQDAPPNNAAALPLFREVGAEWLQSLTPEEKNLALVLHREWFHPALHLRHRNRVWILPTTVPVINDWLSRYDGLREEIDLFPFSPFPGDPAAPDFATHYETDGFFAAPRLATCDCATDVDCLPGWVCHVSIPAPPSDPFTCCHLLGVIIPCQGKCLPSEKMPAPAVQSSS